MGDVTALVVLGAAELWHATADGAAVARAWPALMRALGWMLDNAAPTGLPRFLETTYDHFGFGGKETVAYNAFIYLAALSAGAEMAAFVADAPLQSRVAAAQLAARAAVTDLLWNTSAGFFRAWAGGDALFTDTLYGILLSHALGYGLQVSPAMLESHLTAEWAANADAFGMRVISNPILEDSVWMNGPPTWAYLSLVLAGAGQRVVPPADLDAALMPLKRMIDNYRSRLNDLWNLRALTHTATEGSALEHGGPREQGHYGFMLTDMWLYPLLSGQMTALHNGTLRLTPAFAPPYVLPVLLVGTLGSLEVDASGSNFTLSIAAGSLALPAGGLIVNGLSYPGGALALGAGQFVEWQQ